MDPELIISNARKSSWLLFPLSSCHVAQRYLISPVNELTGGCYCCVDITPEHSHATPRIVCERNPFAGFDIEQLKLPFLKGIFRTAIIRMEY